jgi:hypothetical protein
VGIKACRTCARDVAAAAKTGDGNHRNVLVAIDVS